MQITDALGLTFPPDEAGYLGSIFRGYFPNNHTSLLEEDKQEIQALWSKVSDALWFALFNLGEDEQFPPDYPEITTANLNNAVGKAIGWAALHMVPGTPFITEWAGIILDSDYMGVIPEGTTDELGDEVPRSNDGMANTIAGSFLEAGAKAQEWALQILEASG